MIDLKKKEFHEEGSCIETLEKLQNKLVLIRQELATLESFIRDDATIYQHLFSGGVFLSSVLLFTAILKLRPLGVEASVKHALQSGLGIERTTELIKNPPYQTYSSIVYMMTRMMGGLTTFLGSKTALFFFRSSRNQMRKFFYDKKFKNHGEIIEKIKKLKYEKMRLKTKLKIIIFNLPTIWGRKTTPIQPIEYTLIDKKTDGSSIGAIYSPSDKPEAKWMGKLGLRELTPDEMSGPIGTRVYHGRAVEALKEKLASDFFTLLSQSSYGVPKVRLAEISLESVRSYFENPRDYLEVIVERVNHDRSGHSVLNGIFVMSKYWPGYKNLFELRDCVLGEERISFLDFLKENKNLPEFADIEGEIIPIRGLIELLATARLLGDTDVLGAEGKNAGFVIERDMHHRPLCVRIVKIDPGYAFDFSESNVFYNGFNSNNSDPLKKDGRNIQYAVNPGCLLPWTNLSDSQKKTYLQTFYQALNQLRNEDFINLVLGQEGFHTTPSGKKLRFVERFTQNIATSLQNYLTIQENIFINNLELEMQLSERNSCIEFVSQYGLYAHTQNTEQARGNMPNQRL